MHRFFTEDIAGDTARITGEDVRHIVRVLRLRAGDALTLSDGRGYDYSALITSMTDDVVTCSVRGRRPAASEPLCRVTLFQCLPKAGKMETIVQKCTELGVDAVVPVFSGRCVVQPDRNFENKRVRYQRVAYEAAKQSHRGIVPACGGVLKLDALRPEEFELFLIAYEEEERRTLKSVLREHPGLRRAAVLIGPEGGFAPEEVARLTERGAVPVTLGARILRTETAGMAVLAEMLYELEP